MNYKYTLPVYRNSQYDMDFKYDKITEAKYINTGIFTGNPYIEALPLPKTKEEIAGLNSCFPRLPDKELFSKFPYITQNAAIDQLLSFRMTLPFHIEIEEEFARVLYRSYSARVGYKYRDSVVIKGVVVPVTQKLKAFHRGEAVNGFAMLGVSGCGKSTAMNIVLDHYPQVIIHNIDGEQIVQIVYLYITCEGNSNFSALYQMIGRAIDEALENGNDACEREISKTRTLGGKSLKVREFIQKYSIGVIVFDEIQNIDLSSTKENSIEALMTINNDTHVGLGVLGTEEAYNGLFSKDRTARRLSSFIHAGDYCTDMEQLERIVQGLFITQYFQEDITPDKEIVSAFMEETNGVIEYVVELYMCVLQDYLKQKEKPKVDASYIHHVSKKNRKVIRERIMFNRDSSAERAAKKRALVKQMGGILI